MVVVADWRVVVAVTVRVVKEGVEDNVIWVEVPMSTFCPPVMERLGEETVKSARVDVPVPPLLTANCPVQPRVKFWAEMLPVTLVSLVTPWTTLLLSLAAARVPVKLGMKVRVFAVVVLTLIRMLVSEVVAT